MRVGKDDGGQMSIDFLIGITIFLLAFTFLFAAIPSLFAPFQSNSDELTMTADRAGVVLVENLLVANTSNNMPQPGIIDIDKFNDLNAKLNGPDQVNVRKALGLDAGDCIYKIQVVLQQENGTNLIIPNNDQPGNQNVGQSRRFVFVRYHGTGNPANYPGLKAVLTVRVW